MLIKESDSVFPHVHGIKYIRKEDRKEKVLVISSYIYLQKNV